MNETLQLLINDPSFQNALSLANTGAESEKLIKYGDCFSWCKSQHFVHDYEGMILIAFALTFWFIYFITLNLEKYINFENENEIKILKLINWIALEGAFLLTLGFAILFLVIKNGI